MEKLQTFNVSVSNGNIKLTIRKSIFAVSLPLNFFCATIPNADTESLKSLHTLYVFVPHACWRNLNGIVWSKIFD